MCRTSHSTTNRRRLVESALLVLLLAPPAPGRAEIVNRVVLRVNDEIVTLHDYEELLSQRLQAIRDADLSPDDRRQLNEEAGRSVLREMLDEMLLLSRADQLNITADPAQVDMAVQGAKERAGLETEEQFQMALEQSGMTLEMLRERMERNFILQSIMNREVHSQIQPSEQEGMRYYRDHKEEFREPEKVRLQEVVVLDGEGALSLAESILAEISEGKTLAAAIEPHRLLERTTGIIDLGWVATEDLDSALGAAVGGLEPGSVSEPIPARGGLHLLELLERQESYIRPINEVQNQILARLREQTFQPTLEAYMADLEEEAYIQADPPPEAVGFRVARGERLTIEDLLALPSERESAPDEGPAEETPTPGDG